MNGLLELTGREVYLLSLLFDLYLNPIKTKRSRQNIDCAENRKSVMLQTGVTKDNLSRYIKKYKAKGIFVKDQDNFYVINKALVPILIGGKTIQITMILKAKEDEQ
jgi:hypothetical protein